MRENLIRTIWNKGEVVLNAWGHIPDAFIAETLAHVGWDSVTVDLQHGLSDYRDAVKMFQAISTTAAVPMARVPWNEPGIIMRLLDAGAYGIICPMINTREEAEKFIGACRYPPGGYRSFGPRRATLYGGKDYLEKANETVVTMAMIETVEAVNNIDNILNTPGLDAIYIGPADLNLSLKASKNDNPSELEDAIQEVVDACKKFNIVPGIHTNSSSQAKERIEQGFRFITVQSDAIMLKNASATALNDLKKV
jgi:4-hydroxy-2-oxoheptanedioate aldolase